MDTNTLLDEIAVCGLDCSRCVSRKDGEIQKLSKSLSTALENFEMKALELAAFVPAFQDYDAFLAVLQVLTNGSCEGCRSGQCLNKGCVAKECHKEMGVDFCFQCAEYPCIRNHFNPALERKWKANNEAMKALGLSEFYAQSKKHPRY